ncbi:MAG: hypothetical protein ACYDGR_17235, partial [Candidatus Dormibacteria bacterium]
MRHFLRRTRVRLSLAYGGALSAVALVLAVGFWVGYARLELARVDDSLSAQAQSLLAGLDSQGGSITFQGTDTLPAENPEGIGIRAVLVGPGGKVLDRSGSGVGAEAMVQGGTTFADQPGKARSMTISGTRERVLAEKADLGALGTG